MFVSVVFRFQALIIVVVIGQPTSDQSYSDTCSNMERKIEKVLNVVTKNSLFWKNQRLSSNICLTGK